MAEQTPPLKIELVPGRECGDCNVCCVALTIEDKDLQKPQGYRCKNTLPNKGCAIYDTRPLTCRTFYCGWRSLKWIREPLRPDTSGVLVRMQYGKTDDNPTSRLGVVFSLLTSASLKAEGLAESVAAAVAANVPVYLHVPGPPGYTASQARINEVLINAVMTKDKVAVCGSAGEARARGRTGKHRPIVLMREGDAATEDVINATPTVSPVARPGPRRWS